MSPHSGPTPASFDVLVLVAPADTLEVASAVLAELPAEWPAPVLIHGASDAAGVLGRLTRRPVDLAENGTVLQAGRVYLSPPHTVLEVRPDRRCAVTRPEVHTARPLDRLLLSLAESFGPRAVAVILAGPGRDGAAGACALRGAGGTVLVGDPASAAPADLPRAVMEAGAAGLVLPPGDLGRTVTDLLAGRRVPGAAAAPAGQRVEGNPREQDRFVALADDITGRKRREANQDVLVEISKDLGQLSGEEELLHTVGAKLTAHLGLTCYHYVDVDEDRAEVTVRHFWHALDVPSILGTYPIDGFIPQGGLSRLRAGEPSVIHDAQNDPPGDTAALVALRAGAAAQKIGAYIAVPYSQDGRWKAYFAVADSRARRWTGPEVELVQEIASRLFPRIERVRAEAALHVSEARYRLAEAATHGFSYDWNLETLNGTPGGLTSRTAPEVVRQSLDTLRPTYSGGFTAVLGYPQDEVPLTRAAWQALLHPDDLERVAAEYEQGVRAGHYSVEYRLRHKEGRYLDVLDRGVAIYNEQGQMRRILGSVVDITERKRAERVLRASEERQAFLLGLSDALRPLDAAAEIQGEATRLLREHLAAGWCYYVEWDEAAARGVVLRDATRGGLPSLAGTHDVSDVPAFFDLLRKENVLTVGDYARFEELSPEIRARYTALGFRSMLVATLVKQGRLVASLLVGDTEVRDWSGDAEALLEEVAERTWAAIERARAEAALAESEGRLRTLMEHLPGAAVFVVDHDLRYVLAQGEALAAVGLTPEDLVGRTVAQTMGPELAPGYEALYRQALAGEGFDYEHTAHGRTFITRGVPLRNAAGRISAALAVSYDITERKRAEAALQASETRFRAVANLVPDLLWESLPDGFTTWHNQRWLEYTGQTFEQATGWGWMDAVHPEDREGSSQQYRQGVRANQPLRQEHRIRRHDGEYRWFVVNTFPVRDERGEVVRVYGAATDIHHLRALNADLEARVAERTRRLADLNAELGNVITRTAHNLEAPARRLGHLLDPGRPVDPEALDGLSPYDPAALHDEVTRLRGVAQDLRQLARLEGQDVTKDLLPLGELFEEVRAEVAATPRGAQVYWLINPLPIVRGDRSLLRQALEVLMTFTLSETRGARYVTVSSQDVEGEVQVTVEDNGLGLTGEEAATLFDLAVRTDQAVPVLSGSGLVQVRRILARHGGWAWAEAQRMSGKVVLAFPRDEAVNELEALFRQDKPGW